MNTELGFIHEFVPGSSDRTLLLLHGTGGNEHDLLPLGRELDPTAALLSPRGPVLENGHARFFRRLAEGVFDLEDLKRRTDELAHFVIAAAERHNFDRAKLVAVGYSNGANIAASLLLRRPDVLRSAVLFRAMVPLIPEELPDLAGVRVWIGGGKQDLIIPRANTEQLAEILSEAGAEVTAHFFDAGHGLTSIELAVAKRWLEPPIKGESPAA
jgi:phospholipase/carboxylesterase